MARKIFIILMGLGYCLFSAQQNEEFYYVKNYFANQRTLIINQYQKEVGKLNYLQQVAAKTQLNHFLKKVDSVENAAYVSALIKVKNREDLFRVSGRVSVLPEIKNLDALQQPQYPGGMNKLREQVADLFYFNSEFNKNKTLQAMVSFIVEPSGYISGVKAEGEDINFNRQAEIAVYLLPEKFSPAMQNGSFVRYKFRMPLTMTFE